MHLPQSMLPDLQSKPQHIQALERGRSLQMPEQPFHTHRPIQPAWNIPSPESKTGQYLQMPEEYKTESFQSETSEPAPESPSVLCPKTTN